MTIIVVFMTKNEVVLRITIDVTDFYCKITRELTMAELKKWIPSLSGTDKKFIEKVWRICVHYGYILENYDVTESDKMKFDLQTITPMSFPTV